MIFLIKNVKYDTDKLEKIAETRTGRINLLEQMVVATERLYVIDENRYALYSVVSKDYTEDVNFCFQIITGEDAKGWVRDNKSDGNLNAKEGKKAMDRIAGNEVRDFILNHYKTGELIYPDAVGRKITPDHKNAVLKEYGNLEKERKIRKIYQIKCPYCAYFMHKTYKNKKDIPDELFCINCDEKIENPSEYAIMLYQKI